MSVLTLNAEQQEAVQHREGQAVVFAGAGSGKTRIITARIAMLIDQGVAPWHILAVTFTNRAANEMRERVEQLSSQSRKSLIATFHSACARWLREFAGELGLPSNFLIYDQRDSNTALKTVLNNLNIPLDDDNSVTSYQWTISQAKINCIFADENDKVAHYHPLLIASGGLNIYRAYQDYLRSCNAVDFGDLILSVVFLLRRNERVRESLQNRCRYILVDEYQDINQCQFELIQLLAAKHRNLFVVGDDDQSIYSWRGASPHKILQFQEVYPQAKKIILNRNYRSSATIISAAGALIARNSARVAKEIWTANDAGSLIEFKREADAEMEAHTIVDSIVSEQDEFPRREIAIFYRTNSQSRLLEDTLRRQNVSYQIYGSLRFYDRVEIKDIIAWLRLVANTNDDASFRRVINAPRSGIGRRSVELIEQHAVRAKRSLLQQTRRMVQENFPKLANKLKHFVNTFETLQNSLRTGGLASTLQIFLQTVDYLQHLDKKYRDQATEKKENVMELDTALRDFASRDPEATLDDWLQSVVLVGDEMHQSGESVALMTLHAAKGLEFDRVYISGVEEGLIPHRNSVSSRAELEEERRLLYVGMTRAKQKLTLTCAARRRVFQNWTDNTPSRFMADIPSTCLQSERPPTPPPRAFAANGQVQRLSVGMQIVHPTYGMGHIASIEKSFDTIDVLVNFNEFGMIRVKSHHLRI